MRIIKAIVGALVAVGVLAAGPAMLRAQGITYNQVITWAGSATTSTTGPSDIIRDVNQTGAWVFVCSNAVSSSATFELEGSYDKVSWFQISSQVKTVGGVASQCAASLASGYFPFTRLNIVAVTGASPSISANYSASFTPIDQQGVQRFGEQSEKVMPNAVSVKWDDNVNDIPINFANADIAVSSVTVYNPNTTVVYAMLSPTNTPAATTGGFAVAVPPTSALTVAMPVPLAPMATTAVPVYAMCSTSRGSLAAPATDCEMTVIYAPLPSINVLLNAAGVVKATAIDTAPW